MRTWRWPVVARYAAGLFSVSFAVALGSNLGLSLVLERSGAQGLPSLIIVHAVLLSITAAMLTRLGQRRMSRWLAASLALTAVLVVAAGVMDGADAPSSAGVFYLATNVLGDVATTLFWVMANQLFDLRAAKRAFPKIGAAGTSGAALAGFLAPAMTGAIGVHGMVVVLLATLSASACFCWWLGRPAVAGQRPRPTPRARTSAPRLAREDARLMRAIVAGVIVVTAVTLFGRFLYARALEQAYAGDAATIAAQNGLFMGAGSVLTTLTQLSIAPALISRVGVRAAMTVYPVMMTGVFAALGARFGLVTGVVAHFATSVLRKGLQAPAEGVLPSALSAEQSSRAVLLVTAVGAPAGMVLAGAALRLGRAWSSTALSAVGVALAALLLAITAWRARGYQAALGQRLKKGGSELRLRLKGTLWDVRDLRAALTRQLDPGDPALLSRLETLAVAQREAEQAGHTPTIDVAPLARVIDDRLSEAYRLRAALDHLPRPVAPTGLDELWRGAVRYRLEQDLQIVLVALRASTRRAELDRVTPRLFDVDPSARGAAVEVLETLCPADLRPLLIPLVEDVGLEEGRAAAARRFGPPNADPVVDLLDIEDSWLRAITVYAVASIGAGRYHDRIRALQGRADPWLELACSRALSTPSAARS